MIGLPGIGRHRRLRGLLSAYVDGETTSGQSARVERHLAGCDSCRQDLDSLRATVHLLRDLPPLEMPRSFALRAEPSVATRPVGFMWASGLATSVAAALVVALLLGDAFEILSQSGLQKDAVLAGEAQSVAPLEAPEMAEALVEKIQPEMQAAPPLPQPAAAPRIMAVEEDETAEAPKAAAMMAAAAPEEDVDAAVEYEDSQKAAPALVSEEIEAEQPPALPSEELEVEQPPALPPEETAVVVGERTAGAGQDEDGGISIPLWQLQVAAGSGTAALLAITLWTAWRRRGWHR